MENNDLTTTIEYKGKKLELVFNLNVMKTIQKRFGSFDEWISLTDGSKNGEVDIEALIFGMMEMINEGIEIKNEDEGTDEPLLSEKKIGRIITEYGLTEATKALRTAVVESTKDDSPKNE